MIEPKSKELLLRAADKLQDYCAEVDGDLNDSLADEIYEFLGIGNIKGEEVKSVEPIRQN